MVKGGMIQKATICILILGTLTSCGDALSTKRTPKDKGNTEEFQNSPIAKITEELSEMGTETRALILPNEGETLEYKVTYSNVKTTAMNLQDGNSLINCRVKFKAATIKETILKRENKTYDLEKTLIPIEPVWDGIDISDHEEKCKKAFAEEKKKNTYPMSIDTQLKKFKEFVVNNFVDKYTKCAKRVRPQYYTCKDEGIEVQTGSADFVDYQRMIFVGKNKGKGLRIEAALNFQRIYFTNFGVLKMELLGTNSIDFSNVATIKTVNWTK